MRRILVLQGANLRTLGRREQDVYGTMTAQELEERIRRFAAEAGFEVVLEHTNGEGVAIDILDGVRDGGVSGVVINPGGFLHGALALRDCLRAFPTPTIEVHLSNIEKRGMSSVLTSAVTGVVAGFGADSYAVAFDAMRRLLDKDAKRDTLANV